MRTLLIVAVVLGAIGCRQSGDGGPQHDANWDAQADVFDRQTERMDGILRQQEHELLRITVQNDRFDKVLTKWEEQALRMDAVIEAQEKQAGVKP